MPWHPEIRNGLTTAHNDQRAKTNKDCECQILLSLKRMRESGPTRSFNNEIGEEMARPATRPAAGATASVSLLWPHAPYTFGWSPHPEPA